MHNQIFEDERIGRALSMVLCIAFTIYMVRIVRNNYITCISVLAGALDAAANMNVRYVCVCAALPR